MLIDSVRECQGDAEMQNNQQNSESSQENQQEQDSSENCSLQKTLGSNISTPSEQNNENQEREPLFALFEGNREAANNFVEIFGGSVFDAIAFIKKFDVTSLAEEHLKKIIKECDTSKDNTCGDNCKWIFDEGTKMLFIRGSGKMEDYKWDDVKEHQQLLGLQKENK